MEEDERGSDCAVDEEDMNLGPTASSQVCGLAIFVCVTGCTCAGQVYLPGGDDESQPEELEHDSSAYHMLHTVSCGSATRQICTELLRCRLKLELHASVSTSSETLLVVLLASSRSFLCLGPV